METVDDLRQRGNHEFQQGNLDNALNFYTAALEKAGTDTNARIINLCNRSACHFQLEDFESAMTDALQAWQLSEEANVKAAYRLGKTYIALQEADKAIRVLNVALTIPDLNPKEAESLSNLLNQAQEKALQPSPALERTIKGVRRPISIREFNKGKSLGVGNFSEIIVVSHKVTHEQFALKILEKKQATDLAKRQHPNVFNEIAMERRVLLERLHPHPRVVMMYHAFQDYNNLYYLMDLHNVNTDLWSCIRYKGKMVGTHPSMTKRWLLQLIDALEHMHSHGIVHRDLKPENILLNERNHVVVIDFGTAKDLIQTDLNGPEFVGTPDFMSPEAVTGFSGMPGDDKSKEGSSDGQGSNHSADLWALGAVAYILHTGSTPFWSPSPYLTFLRIKRGLLPRNSWAMPDEETWSFCSSLMQVDPTKRLGFDCFQVSNGKVTTRTGYGILRTHPYLNGANAATKELGSHVIPSLQDLAIRACAEMVQNDALDIELCDQHPPGDKSSHDLMRLSSSQRNLVWHVLDKCKVFKDGDETRVFQRFFDKDIDFLRAKVRPASRDFVGLTQMNDDEYKPQSHRGSQDPYAKKEEPEPTKIVILRNPWLVEMGETTKDDETLWLKGWKSSISHINKQRPKAVVVCAPHIPDKLWKFLCRIRDSIPLIWNDGSVFYSFWLNGFQGIVIQKSGFDYVDGSTIEETLQMKWLREQMEQARMAKHQVFCFCDCDPRALPSLVLKRLARGRVLCLYGVSKEDLDYTVEYAPNETVDDNASVKSTDSQEDKEDGQTMRVLASNNNGIEWLSVEEKEKWTRSFEAL